MPQASFILKEPNSSDDTLIFLLYRFHNEKLKYSTGQKINPKFWNPEKQRAKESRQAKGHANLNFLLDKIETTVNGSYRRLVLEDIKPNPALLRYELDKSLNKVIEVKEDLISFGEKVIEGSSRQEGSKRAIKQTLRILMDFKNATNKDLGFESIDLEFYDRFIEYLHSKNYGVNTIGNQIKNVKVFMREAFERGLTKNLNFKSRRFKKPEEESESIYLSQEEILALLDLDLTANKRLERVRDLFVIACFTGLRFSDFSQLKPENLINENKVLRVRTQKTGEVVMIPVNRHVRQILEKYNWVPPQSYSNQKMNDYLKDLGKVGELNQEIIISATSGGIRKTEKYYKWELITTHTARRSFATNAYLQNVPTISIMKITGHKTEKSFLKYIKISQEDNANKLITHPFFL